MQKKIPLTSSVGVNVLVGVFVGTNVIVTLSDSVGLGVEVGNSVGVDVDDALGLREELKVSVKDAVGSGVADDVRVGVAAKSMGRMKNAIWLST